MCWCRTENMIFVYRVLLIPTVLVVCRSTEPSSPDTNKFTVCKNHHASSRIKELWNTRNVFYCYFYCGRNSWCRALTIKPASGGVECTFHSGIFDVTCNSFPFIENLGYRLLIKNERYEPADSGGGCTPPKGSCQCSEGFAGSACDRYVHDCKEAKDTGVVLNVLTSVMVKPINSDLAFEALCNEYGQIAILTRNIDGDDVMFNRSWEEYKHPFGTYGVFWLGLEHIYAILHQGDNVTFKLQIYCRNFTNDNGFSVFYQTFSIQSESNGYEMTTGSTSDTENDGFGGNAPFCTHDRPCNGYPHHLNGGWWYVTGLENYALTNPKSSLTFKYQNNTISVHQVSMSLERYDIIG